MKAKPKKGDICRETFTSSGIEYIDLLLIQLLPDVDECANFFCSSNSGKTVIPSSHHPLVYTSIERVRGANPF